MAGFPCLIAGTTDMDRHFHPFGFAVCSNEVEEDFRFIFESIKDHNHDNKNLILVSDSSDAIRNAFENVNESKNKVMCWAHVRRCVEKKLSLIDNEDHRNEILNDIETLQISKDVPTFEFAKKLFHKKWKNEERFLNYSINECLSSKDG